MKLQKNKSDDGRVVTFHIPEKFDYELHSEFRELYQDENKCEDVVLDMRKTEYMDSSALGMMLQLKEFSEKSNSKISVTNTNSNIMKILKIANFDKLFSIN